MKAESPNGGLISGGGGGGCVLLTSFPAAQRRIKGSPSDKF